MPSSDIALKILGSIHGKLSVLAHSYYKRLIAQIYKLPVPHGNDALELLIIKVCSLSEFRFIVIMYRE